MRKLLSLLLIFTILALSGCAKAPAAQPSFLPTEAPVETPEGTPEPPSAEDADLDLRADLLVQAENLGLRLLQNGMQADTAGNTVLSPMGLTAAMAALYLGSAGETAEQLRAAAGFTAEPEDVLSAYAALDEGISAQLLLSSRYAAAEGFSAALAAAGLPLSSAQFGADAGTAQLNQAAAAFGEPFADAFASTIPSDVLYILTGCRCALTFAVPFPALERYAGLFESPAGLIPCDFLYTEGDMPYYEDERVRICSLPLQDEGMELLLILPQGGETLTDTAELLGQYGGEWLSPEDLKAYPVRLSLPVLSIEQNASLRDDLLALGVTLPFDQLQADFSPMLEGDLPMSLTDVRSLAELSVSESGINVPAAAPAQAAFTPSEAGADFTLDRPFLLAVRDTGVGATRLLAWINAPSTTEEAAD